ASRGLRRGALRARRLLRIHGRPARSGSRSAAGRLINISRHRLHLWEKRAGSHVSTRLFSSNLGSCRCHPSHSETAPLDWPTAEGVGRADDEPIEWDDVEEDEVGPVKLIFLKTPVGVATSPSCATRSCRDRYRAR